MVHLLTMTTDKWEDPTVRQLTPRLLPIFQSVLSDEDQLEDERRQELTELVSYINSNM